jgi:hypothetical protein
MNADRMAALEDVNRQVNGSIAATRDTSRFHFWKLNVAQGDCNNYAIQKRHELMQRGWRAGALSLSVVKTSWGEGHLVVTVRTDAGEYVLDNLRPNIVDWRRTGYRWLMRQSSHNPQYWVALNGAAAAQPALASGEADIAATSQAEDDALAAKLASVAAAKRARVARASERAPIGRRGGSGMYMGMGDFSALSGASAPANRALTLGTTQGAAAQFTARQSMNTEAWAGSASWIAFVDAWGLWQSIDETPTS